MLTKVDITTPQGSLLSLPLDDDSSGFRVAEIEGLDPVKATLVSSSFAQVDGEQYQSSRRETRNLKLKIELDPDPLTDTVRSLRQKLYTYFMPKTEAVYIFYMEDGLQVNIGGRVESFETALFTREPAVDISIICYDPDFIDPVSADILGMTTADVNPTNVDYEGTVETGVKFNLSVDRSVDQFTIYHTTPSGEIRTLEFSGSLIAGDELHIITIPGEKDAYYFRSGVKTNILYGISPESSWIALEPGVNQLKVYAEGAGIPLTFEYYIRYGGL